MKTQNDYNPLHILGANGWKWRHYPHDEVIQMDDNEDYDVYTMEFLGVYHTLVRAVVSAHSKHLMVDGHYGVLWIDVVKYECDPPHSENDLNDMIAAIEMAEKNLLKIGMPFSSDYQFHGNKVKRQRKNEKLRALYNLDELEKADFEKI